MENRMNKMLIENKINLAKAEIQKLENQLTNIMDKPKFIKAQSKLQLELDKINKVIENYDNTPVSFKSYSERFNNNFILDQPCYNSMTRGIGYIENT